MNKPNRFTKLKIILIMLIAGLSGIQIYFANRTINMGTSLAALEEQTEKLQLENQALEMKLAEAMSLGQIKSKAELMGFSPTTKVLNLPGEEKLALNF